MRMWTEQACRLQYFSRISSIHFPSAAGTNNAIGSCSQPQTPDYISSFENCSDIPTVPDIFADLDTELDIEKLEEFAQSLLQDITADMEATSAQKQITTSDIQQDNPRKVVGASSKQLESSRGESIVPKIEDCSDQLHTKIDIKPTIEPIPIPAEPETVDIIYTSVNDSENCITIVVANEVDIPISEVETEVVTSTEETESTLNLADYVSSYKVDADEGIEDTGLTLHDYLKSEENEIALSDCGYESLDSPHSESNDVEMSELWNQSFTELFPNLM